MKSLIVILTLFASVIAPAMAQEQEDTSALEALVAEARASNPEIRAARSTAEAAAARVPQAGALPDPMLSVGVMNAPLPSLDLAAEGMTMATVQVGQRIPVPGSRGLRGSIARKAHQAVQWEAEETAIEVISRLKSAYYELHFTERALGVLTRNRALLVDLAEVTGGRFAVGRVPQSDVLRAQTEITRLDEQTAGLEARRSAALAEVNAILQRPSTGAIQTEYPKRVLALANGAPTRVSFTSAALDGGLGDGFPSLAELQEAAVRERPMLLAQAHRIAAAREGVRLAERERWPDADLMLGYGTRFGRPDMLTATVSVPLPVFAGRKQRQAVTEAGHELAAEDHRHHQMVEEIRSDVATRYAALVRTRERIVLLSDGVVPQAEATVESATVAYQAGRVEFLGLLDAQATLFRNEIELSRQLADFGRELTQLERAVGSELNWE